MWFVKKSRSSRPKLVSDSGLFKADSIISLSKNLSKELVAGVAKSFTPCFIAAFAKKPGLKEITIKKANKSDPKRKPPIEVKNFII